MSEPDVSVLARMGERFAAGYFELPDASPMRRWSRAVRRRFEHRALVPYQGELLYPSGPWTPDVVPENRIVAPSYSFTWTFNRSAWERALEEAATAAEGVTLRDLKTAMEALEEKRSVWDSPHTVGGRGYTHSIPNYGRVLREGLDAHAARVQAGLASAAERADPDKRDFYLGLADVLAGIRAWHRRILDELRAWDAPTAQQAQRRARLLKALERVPFQPARSFYEAVVAYNFVFYLDDCDNPGRLDRELDPYYRHDVEGGILERDDALAMLRAFTDNVCAHNAWSAAIGGSLEDGTPAYNEVTRLCLEAVRNKHRPSYELGVRDDMPDAVWATALETVSTGCGQPAFYNDRAYIEGLRQADLGVREEDLVLWNGGGCTETMIHGRSNVGSLDAGIHLPLILEETLARDLAQVSSFDQLLARFKEDITEVVEDITAGVNALQVAKAAWAPQPMRTLLIDDCIDRGVEFNAGGARYNWSVVNVAGLANVVDSLAAVREVVFEKGEVVAEALMTALAQDFSGREVLRQRLRRCPRFGNDIAGVDELAADIAHHVFEAFRGRVPWRGGRFLPSCIMFTTYAIEGAKVGATPDGRRAGDPLADSIGPAAGRDRHGPTAMLRSVTRLPLHLAVGTPVLNMRFSKKLLTSAEGRQAVRDLISTYFRLGGMQIQLSVMDREVLEDAMAHPERHEDLIVRVGGFSAYFNGLSPELQRTIVERTEHTP
ncbi:MAG: pyruvate formate lyase family protein [Anaerolineae bacterium]